MNWEISLSTEPSYYWPVHRLNLGRWARGIRNKLMTETEQYSIIIPPYPVQNNLAAGLRKLAQQANDTGYTSLWAGQSAGRAKVVPAKEVFMNLVEQYRVLDG